MRVLEAGSLNWNSGRRVCSAQRSYNWTAYQERTCIFLDKTLSFGTEDLAIKEHYTLISLAEFLATQGLTEADIPAPSTTES